MIARRLICLAAAVFLLSSTVTADAPRSASAEPVDSLAARQQLVFRHAHRVVSRSIVRIDTIGGAQPVRTETDRAGHFRTTPGFRQADGPTTGVIWSADGYILTSSFNFVRDPTIITVTLADGRRFVARLVARDHQSRLALLKIDATGLPASAWVDRADLRPGQWTLAAGFGYGGDNSCLSVGILSAVSRMSGQAVQTDARLSPAHYGGPLFDLEGRVIGICVPISPGDDELAGVQWYDSGIGFAIHHEHIIRRMPRLLRGEDLRRGLLGINLDLRASVVGDKAGVGGDAPGAAGDDKLPPSDGVRIVGSPRGPAAEAGLQVDDIIVGVDGVPTPRLVDFKRAIALKAAGDEITVAYRRGSEAHAVTLTLVDANYFTFAKPPTTKPAKTP